MQYRLAVIVAALLCATSSISYARGGGGPGGGNFGGMSSGHIGSHGLSNSNGPNAIDRGKGLDRAHDRMSSKGLDHAKSGTAHVVRHPKPPKVKARPAPRVRRHHVAPGPVLPPGPGLPAPHVPGPRLPGPRLP